MRNCYDCGDTTECVYTESYGWMCSSCLFKRVEAGSLALVDVLCANGCGAQAYYCEECGDNHDYCHEDDESSCDDCGDFDYVLCQTCANRWKLCDMEGCEEPVVYMYCDRHLQQDGVLFTEIAAVDQDGVMTVGDTVVNWS